MSIRSAVYSLLSSIEADSYPLYAPQETTDPYVVYSMRIVPILTQDFTGPDDVDLTLDIYASTFAEAVSLADTMYAAMDNASGTYSDKELMLSRFVSESDSFISGVEKVNITQEYNLKFV